MKTFTLGLLFISFLIFFYPPSSNLYCQVNSERQLYENDELFKQLSGAKQTILEQKFGKKETSVEEIIHSSPGREALQANSSQNTLNGVNAVDIQINNNTGATGTAFFTQSETGILAFGNNVVAGFNDAGSINGASKFTGFSNSVDGGISFVDGGTLPTNAGGDAGDPVLARDETTGRIYFATLGFNVSTIQVFRSDNNGLTWLAPVNGTPGGSSEDKQWMTVDNFAGAGNGNIYLMSRRFGGVPGIYMFKSTDQGATFGPAGGVMLVSNQQGAFVVVGPDHSVYAFWLNTSTMEILMRKSVDFGVSFAPAVLVAGGLSGPEVNGGLGLVGIRNGLGTSDDFRSNSFPHAAVNPANGDLYVTFNDNPAGGDKGDIYMVMSSDGGTSWTAPVRVNDDVTTTDQWMPTIATSPLGNYLGIFYYSREEDPAGNNLFKYYGRIGAISGSTVTFAPSFPISDVASLPEFGRDAVVNSLYMGDYNYASATANAFHVVWSDNRNDLPGGAPRKDPNVYYDMIPIPQSDFLVWEGVLGGQDYSGDYINSFLTGLGYTVDYTTLFPPSLIGYDAVFLSFGNFGASGSNTVFDASMAAIVQAYLEAGGSVYLEGGDALEFDQSANTVLHDLFGLGAGSDGSTNVIDGLQGQVGSLADGMLFTASSQVNNGYIDIYLPSTGTTAFNESAYGDVAVQYSSGGYGQKTFCFSYALAYLTDAVFPNRRDELTTRILNFLLGNPVLPPDIGVTPSSFTFSLPQGSVDLGVLTLSNLGEQALNWNVSEQEPLAAGIKLQLKDGRELPVNVKPKYDWTKPVKGEDFVPYPPSVGKPPLDLTFKPLYEYESIENQTLFGTDAFGNEDVNGNFVQFDLGVPEVLNPISPMTDLIWAGDFGMDLTFAYSVNPTQDEFYRIDKTTGAVAVIGPCAPNQNPPGEIFTGMAIDPTTGIIYLSSTDITTSWLYTVDPSTGTPSLIGVITNSPGMIAIAINNSGQMYGYDIISDIMLSVDKSTGVGTVLGALGFDANFGQGMDFDPITGTLYLAAFNNSTGQAELRTGNTTTGNTTLVGVLGSTTPGGLTQLGWVGLPGEYSDCPWLSASPVSGVIAGGFNQDVDVTVDATGLTPGTYNCELIISSNDPVDPTVIVPVTLNVLTPPDINVTPTALTFVVPENGSDTQQLTIENTAVPGSQDLDWNIIEQSVVIFDNGLELPVNLNLSSNSSQIVKVNEEKKDSEKNIKSSFTESYLKNSFIERDNLSKNAVIDVRSVKDGKYVSTPANAGPECSGGLIYDDGTVENGYGWTTLVTDGITLTQITPPYYPYDIGQICINWTTVTGVNLNYNLVVYDDDGAGGAPGTLLASIPVSANGVPVWPLFAFYDYDVTGSIPSVTSGGVYVGAQWDPSVEGEFYICADESPTTPYHLGYGYNDFDGIWQTIDYWYASYEAMFIRVEAALEDIPWISENPLNGSVPAGNNQIVDVTVNATGLTIGTYNCNLLVLSNDPDENPVTVPVTLIVTGPPPDNFGIVTNVNDNNIHIIDVDNNTIVGPFLSGSLGSGFLLDPVITPDGQKALITSFSDSIVYFIDVTNPYSPSVYGGVNVGFNAEDIALSPDGAYAVVTDGGTLSPIAVIDVGAVSVIQTLNISPRMAMACAIAPDGTVLLADYPNNQIHIFLMNLSTGLLTDLSTAIAASPGPLNITVGPDGQTALVANGNSTSIDVLQITGPGAVTLTGSVPNILNAQSIAFEKNGNRAFVVQDGTSPDELAVLSVTSPGNVIDTGFRIGLISDALAGFYGVDVIDISADGNWAYCGNPDLFANTDVAVVDLNSYTLATSLTAGNYPTGIAVAGANTFQLSVVVADGWNMVSVPGNNPAGMGVTDWWSGKDPAADVFKYSGGYISVTTTAPTEGYWMKNSGAQVYNYPAIDVVTHNDINAASGWNMIGGYENTVPVGNLTTTPPGLITGTIFEYSGGYVPASNITPGYGYWVKMSAAGLIGGLSAPPLGKVSNPVAEEYIQDDWGKIKITDNSGVNYTLYAVKSEVNLDSYELPPSPPAGMFDIRYSSGRIAEDLTSSQSIEMNSVQYPVTIRVENMTLNIQDPSGTEINASINPGEEVTINNSSINKLIVLSDGLNIPTEYVLEQNYPNPFNPSTIIKFSLPEVTDVTLSIYNTLGQKVAQLVNSKLEAGRYSYQWDAGNVATGMYIYELRTDNFVSVKKMLLLK